MLPYEFKHLKLGKLGNDALGITLFFNFNNARENKPPRGHKTPRFM